MDDLVVEHIHKRFDKTIVLLDVSFSVMEKEFLTILGVSGCGKTTLLRLIAGLETCDGGRISLGGENITDIPPGKRNIGMVFQSYALFPNMTVIQNITYPLFHKKLFTKTHTSTELIDKVIESCGLTEIIDKYPYQLSGGQQQRTAIARSLVFSPKVLLFDEPFSALDATLRRTLGKLVKKFQSDFGSTIIYVTHDQEEAFSLSDRILILNNGLVQQIGKPSQIYQSPANDFVNEFVNTQLRERYINLSRAIENEKTSASENKKEREKQGVVCNLR